MAEIVIAREFEFQPPDGLNIYRLRRPDVSEDVVRDTGSRFGLAGTVTAGTFVQNARSIFYTERSAWGLRLFRNSGGWQYRDAARWQIEAGPGSLRIDDGEAAALAVDAVTRFDLAVSADLELAQVERLQVAHADRSGGNHSERAIGARIVFRRIRDGLASAGPGGKTVIFFDAERQLTGIDHLWREIDDVLEPVTRLRPVSQVLDEVRRRYGAADGRAEVRDLRLGYFELGWDDRQEYLQPAYEVLLELFSPDDRFRMGATMAVPAAVNSPGPVEREPRRRESQPLRLR
jgi:hypothetical protein